MNWWVYITWFGKERCVAQCEFSDDAELIFESYKQAKTPCRICWDDALSKSDHAVYTGEEGV